MIFIYYVLVCLFHFFSIPFFFLFSFKQRYKESIPARFFFPNNHKSEIYDYWLHACSLGEVKSLQFLIDSIHDTKSIFLTVITHTGYKQAIELFSSRKNVVIEYLPFESLLPFVSPKTRNLFVFEAELWLMLFFVAKKNCSRVKLINARISKRSFKRYYKLKFFYEKLFSYVDSVLAQSSQDCKRLKKIGAKNITVLGNIKSLNKIKSTFNYKRPKRLVIIAASTHNNEEEIVLQAFKEFRPNNCNKDFICKNMQDSDFITREFDNPLFIIVPRHPERFDLVYSLCSKYFETTRFSSLDCNNMDFDNIDCKLLLIDRVGELINLYAIGDITILCGSFEKKGGHNPLEPATFCNVLISGKEIFNQMALFSFVKNYYLIESNELSHILSCYKNLHSSKIDLKTTNEMINIILDSKVGE